jgi:photosystem II stability/assembly factor-like uncharacterized protein
MRKWTIIVLMLCFTAAHAQQYTWQVIARPTTLGLRTVEFVDSLNGWTAAVGSSIYKTTDGGNTWTAYSGTPMQLKSISMVDTSYGWCVGDDGFFGRIIRTTTGGRSWQLQFEYPQRAYRGGAAQSKLRETTPGGKNAGTDTAFITQTTNGGTSWQEQRFDSIGQLHRVFFTDSLHGWITSQYQNILLRTTNGGESWQRYATPYQFPAFHFIDTLRGWAGIASGFYRTTDGGLNWQFLYRVPFLEDFEVHDISFVDSLNGWAFGETAEPGPITEAIYRTTNGGVSWYRESVGLTSDLGGLADGIMLDDRHGWTVATDGRVLAYRPVTSIVEKSSGVPKTFALHQNYPNPFNPTTTIEYELSRRSNVNLTVHDLLGRYVKTLVHQLQDAGIYRTVFDASRLATGAYFYTLETPEFKETKQLLLTK